MRQIKHNGKEGTGVASTGPFWPCLIKLSLESLETKQWQYFTIYLAKYVIFDEMMMNYNYDCSHNTGQTGNVCGCCGEYPALCIALQFTTLLIISVKLPPSANYFKLVFPKTISNHVLI